MIIRAQNKELLARLAEPRRTIQVIAGPRQVGKTTMINQVLKQVNIPYLFFNADAVAEPIDSQWIAARWEEARAQMRFRNEKEFLLVIDEIHKIDNWSEKVKLEWDTDTFHDTNIKVVLLGSSRLLLKKGLTESLAGRFELLPMGHWSFAEMQEAFGWDISRYVYFGGYPGSAAYAGNEVRWRKYMRQSGLSTSEIIGRFQSLMCCRKKDGTITVETPNKQVKEYYKLFGFNVPAHVKEESCRKEIGLKV